jgi:hypothetical protein
MKIKQFLSLLLIMLCTTAAVKAVPILNSLPGSANVIYLDFDGQIVQHPAWQNGNAFTCAPSILTNPQITAIYSIVSEDFKPFNVNITTDEAVFLAANAFSKMRVIFTSTPNWLPNPNIYLPTPDYNGMSISNSFFAGNNTPSFVFETELFSYYNERDLADLCSHQLGHTLGLHDIAQFGTSNCATPINYFHPPLGFGETDWAPIMGDPYYSDNSRWVLGSKSVGPCTNIEDQLAILVTGLGYRVDAIPNIGSPTLPNILVGTATTFTQTGIIETNTDKDVFKLTLSSNSKISFSIRPNNLSTTPIYINKPNLDVVLKLYNITNNLIASFEPANSVSVVIPDLYLNAGTYYFEISGGANVNSITNYGSLGEYSFTGNVTDAALPPAPTIPIFNSLTASTKTIYLDFDGEVVTNGFSNYGVPFNFFTAASTMTSTQILKICNIVAEDFRPFNVNVTTDNATYLAASPTARTKILITTPNSWNASYFNTGSITGSFYTGNRTNIVFENTVNFNVNNLAEACGKEIGKTLGLSETFGLAVGTGGTGETSLAAIMENPFGKNCTRWNGISNGLILNHLQIIANGVGVPNTTYPGIGYRVDDYPNAGSISLPNIVIGTATNFTQEGIIETTGDKDFFKLEVANRTNLTLNVVPFNVGPSNEKANLDVTIKVYTSSNTLISVTAPAETLSANLTNLILLAGTYYIEVSGGPSDNGLNAGSLGAYTLTSSIAIAPPPAIPVLNSLPTATKTIYLDFDGENHVGFWGGTVISPLVIAPSTMNNAQILKIFSIVSEDFRPFNVNVTTDELVYNLTNPFTRVRLLITPTGFWSGSPGGIAVIGDFYKGNNNPAFVFESNIGYNPNAISEAASHEIGHTLGLYHTADYVPNTCTITGNGYSFGIATGGQISYAPIMGVSYNRNCTRWSSLPNPNNCIDIQEQLSIIAFPYVGTGTYPNGTGLEYRVDDYPNVGTSTLPNILPSAATNIFNAEGIIETNTDKDVFKLTILNDYNLSLNVVPYNVGAGNERANLDVVLKVYNSSNNLLYTSEPADILNASLNDVILPSGTYYIEISGGANANTSNYGSLGLYTISGSVGYVTTANGNWSNPATWLGGTVPPAGAIVYVRHQVNGDVSTSCRALTIVQNIGQLTVLNGNNITITH